MAPDVPEADQNKTEVNQAALRWLKDSKQPVDPSQPYSLQLVLAGFEAGVAIPGPGQAYRYSLRMQLDQMFSPDGRKSFEWVTWLFNNPNGPGDADEQEGTMVVELEQAKDWEEAAQ